MEYNHDKSLTYDVLFGNLNMDLIGSYLSSLSKEKLSMLKKDCFSYGPYGAKFSGFFITLEGNTYFIKHSFNDEPSSRLSRSCAWHDRGLLHRDGKPAYKSTMGEQWYNKGLLHREDGPADIAWKGQKREISNWYLYGKRLSNDEIDAIQNLSEQERKQFISLFALKNMI